MELHRVTKGYIWLHKKATHGLYQANIGLHRSTLGYTGFTRSHRVTLGYTGITLGYTGLHKATNAGLHRVMPGYTGVHYSVTLCSPIYVRITMFSLPVTLHV